MAKNKKLTPRRLAREWAMQFLFQMDVLETKLDNDDLNTFWEQLRETTPLDHAESFERAIVFAEELIRGVYENCQEIDNQLTDLSSGWALERISFTDRNILRIASYEILKTTLDNKVIIDEAVEIAKSFGDADSPKYINAILDNLSKSRGR